MTRRLPAPNVQSGPEGSILTTARGRATWSGAGTTFVPEAYWQASDGTNWGLAIQRAIDAASNAGGGVVRLGGRVYTWSGTITVRDGVWLMGSASNGASVGLVATSSTSLLKLGDWATDQRPGGLFQLRIDGDGTGDSGALVQVECVHGQIQYCYITSAAGHNILLNAAQNTTIQETFSTDAGGAALAMCNGSGGYNFLGSHFTSSAKSLLVFDDNGSTGNAYPFGSAHINVWGGIFETYVDGERLCEIRCGSAFHFWGTGFSVNGASVMSEGDVIYISNDDFTSVATYINFNGCNFNGGDEEYPTIHLVGNGAVATFSGETYYQNTTDFILLDSGNPTVREYGVFLAGGGVTNFISTTGGASTINVYNPRKFFNDYRQPSAHPTVFATRRDTDGTSGLRMYIDRDGSIGWQNGASFSPAVTASYNSTNTTLDISALRTTGRYVREIALTTVTGAGSSITLNSQADNVHQVFLNGGTVSTMTISNAVNGAELRVMITQDATGGRTYSWASNMRFAGGSAPADTTASTHTIVNFMYSSGTSQWVEVGRSVAVPYT